MNTNFLPTNDFYRRSLAAPGAAERARLYIDLLVKPWEQMMRMVQGMNPNSSPDDPFAGARMWGWLLPDQVEQIAQMLNVLEAAHAWQVGAEALAQAFSRFAPYAARVPFNAVEGWLVLADPARSNPLERGYSGATDWFQPRLIGQFWAPDADNLARLPGLVAHELHHLVRMRAFPWGMDTSVADYIIIEGLAESFAVELYGKDTVGFFISEFDPAGFAPARDLIGAALDKTGFDVIRAYIFGDALADRAGFRAVGGMPTYGGYAIGYHVVQAFLERTGTKIEDATFLPAMEIVKGSGIWERLA